MLLARVVGFGGDVVNTVQGTVYFNLALRSVYRGGGCSCCCCCGGGWRTAGMCNCVVELLPLRCCRFANSFKLQMMSMTHFARPALIRHTQNHHPLEHPSFPFPSNVILRYFARDHVRTIFSCAGTYLENLHRLAMLLLQVVSSPPVSTTSTVQC